jgi:Zn-dependent protease
MMTSWAITLFRVGETHLRLHPTFFLLLAVIGIAQGLAGGAEAAVRGVVFVSLLFLCVLLHEFGHVFCLQRRSSPARALWRWSTQPAGSKATSCLRTSPNSS